MRASECRAATGANVWATSTITSPTMWTPAVIPSAARFETAVSDGQKRRSASTSTTIRFSSSGMRRSNERRPASTWPIGTCCLAATRAPASVEFVSP